MKKYIVTIEEFDEVCGEATYVRTISKSSPVDYHVALASAHIAASSTLVPQNCRIYINEVNHWNEVKHRERIA